MSNYSFSLKARSSAIQRGQSCQLCSSLTRSGPAKAEGLLASNLPGMDCLSMLQLTHPKVPYPKPGAFQSLKSAKAWPLKVRVEEGRGRSDQNGSSRRTGYRTTVQCGPDEPSWTWIQIWIQARIPDYSLNWTARSSGIQGWQRCQSCSLPTRRWTSRSWRPFGLKSAKEH